MILKGKGASLGRVNGRAELFETKEITPDNIILVDGALTAEIAVRLRAAAGVVASKGGITSHGANILREFGIPCLVGVNGINEIKNGALVSLDCFSGTLEVFGEI